MNRFQFDVVCGSIYIELRLRGYKIKEGASSSEELQFLYKTAQRPAIRNIAEIGFHLGFSSYAFLRARPDIRVTSFDIASHPFVPAAEKIIDRKFPGRHAMVYGDSIKTIPEFAAHNQVKFDLIFIDGGHDYETAKKDLHHMKLLAHPTTIVIMDDLTPWLLWGEGPTQAWQEAMQTGEVAQEELYKDGILVGSISPPGKRGWALGHYIFS
jgi:predicted O-methyltransferase YrrM